MKTSNSNFNLRIIKLLFSAIVILISSILSIAQKVPAINANQLTDSLVFAGTATINFPNVTYNPVAHKYYSARIGNAGFPLHTWNETGGLAIFQDTTGMDTRGIWWNPNTLQVERNCFGNFGWSTINLDASKNATHNFTMLFAGQNQPTMQSVGAYDYKTNTVIYNSNGTIHVYNRNTGTFISSFPLTGTTLTNINTESVIYTGQTNYEIGILDYVAKRILLFNRTTGAFTGMSQLPATALTHNQFRISYANEKVWLFNSTLRKWNSYNIWNSSLLPVELVSFTATKSENNNVNCKWITASEENNDYFTIEKSANGDEFETVNTIAGAGNSTVTLNYAFTDNNPLKGISYYRLKQTDFNGDFSYSKIVAVNRRAENATSLSAFPNPFSTFTTIKINDAQETGFTKISLLDNTGHDVTNDAAITLNDFEIYLDKMNLKPGIYFLVIALNNSKSSATKLIVQ